jgi:glycosyltransferase involved in cell wall biosynthesis
MRKLCCTGHFSAAGAHGIRVGLNRPSSSDPATTEGSPKIPFVGAQRVDGHRVLCFATQGHEHSDAERSRALLEQLVTDEYPFDRTHKLRSALGLWRTVRRQRPALVVMEGTGTAGGIALLAIDALLGVPYVVCSGDAVGPYLGLRSRLMGVLGGLYERLLCRRCAGYVGWTPYLAGRALTFGAPRAMTAPGWSDREPSVGARARVRAQLGVARETLLVGLVGSLHWNARVGYVYGAELVQAIRQVSRQDVAVCILGDGDGMARLRELAGEDLGVRVFLPGRVPAQQVADHLAAFDLASLSQSVDGIGSFRYTIKLSEYIAAGLPVLSGQTPLAYDLDGGWLWRLPGEAPWSPVYLDALVELLGVLTAREVDARREALREAPPAIFDGSLQQRRMREFVQDLLARRARPARRES